MAEKSKDTPSEISGVKPSPKEKVYATLDKELSQPVQLLEPYIEYFKSPNAKLRAIKKGLEPHALTDLLTITGATQMEIAKLLALTEPTLRKYIGAEKELNSGLSEHILQLFELFDKGIDTFGTLEEFKSWLPHHNIGINARPIDLLDTITGINIVMAELTRIDYGVLA